MGRGPVPGPASAPAAEGEAGRVPAGWGGRRLRHTYATLDHPLDEVTDTAGKIPAAGHLRRCLTQLAEAQAWLEPSTQAASATAMP